MDKPKYFREQFAEVTGELKDVQADLGKPQVPSFESHLRVEEKYLSRYQNEIARDSRVLVQAEQAAQVEYNRQLKDIEQLKSLGKSPKISDKADDPNPFVKIIERKHQESVEQKLGEELNKTASNQSSNESAAGTKNRLVSHSAPQRMIDTYGNTASLPLGREDARTNSGTDKKMEKKVFFKKLSAWLGEKYRDLLK